MAGYRARLKRLLAGGGLPYIDIESSCTSGPVDIQAIAQDMDRLGIGLIRRHPNLYFDTAFGDAASVCPLSGQKHARVWGADGGLAPEWLDLIVAHPRRFMSALDLGQDRLWRLAEIDRKHCGFLARLPPETRHQVAYRSAWSLLFGGEFR